MMLREKSRGIWYCCICFLIPVSLLKKSLLNEQAGFVDDLLVYCLAEDDYLLVVNASNIAGDFAWVADHTRERFGDGASVTDESDATALLAVQGAVCAGLASQHPCSVGDGGARGSFIACHRRDIRAV